MGAAQAGRVILTVGAAEAGYVLYASRKGVEDNYRRLWAIGGLALGLSLVAEAAPQVAAPLAILVATTLVFRNRGEIRDTIRRGGGEAQ